MCIDPGTRIATASLSAVYRFAEKELTTYWPEAIKENIMNFLRWFLTLPFWQGIAGLAQALAAVLTIVTIDQARRVLRQGEKAQLASVAPDWQIANEANRLNGVQVSLANIELQNVGFGPACNFEVKFVTHNNHHQGCITSHSSPRGANIMTIFPDEKLHIGLRLEQDEGPMDGTLVVECHSRLGEKITRRYRVEGDATVIERRHFSISPQPGLVSKV